MRCFSRPAAGITLAAAALLLSPGAARGEQSGSTEVTRTPHFVFHSDFDTNLNDALIVAGAARARGRPELFRADASSDGSGTPLDSSVPAAADPSKEAECFAGLAPSARAGWDRAVDWYAEVVSPADWNDRPQVVLRFALAGIEGRDDPRAREYEGIARGFLAAAAPAYRECRWRAQDGANRAWVAGLIPRLERHGEAIGKRLAALYRKEWHGLPIRVDMVPASPPHGANTWILDPGGHIQISSAVDASEALETVFHEASHTLNAPWRPDPIPAALEEAAKQVDMELPRDLWHIVLFYTTGEAIRVILEAAGERPYAPFMEIHDLWSGSWEQYRGAVEAVWPAYLAGERELGESALSLMNAIRGQGHR